MTETPGPSAPGWSAPAGAPEAQPTGAPEYLAKTPATNIRPGVIPLRPLSLGELLDGAFATIRRHPLVTFGVAATVVMAQIVIQLLVGLAMRDVSGSFGSTSFMVPVDNGSEIDSEFSATPFVSSGLTFIVSGVLTAIVAGAITLVVADAVLGRQVRGADIWQRTRERLWALLGASIISGLLPFLPFVGGVVLLMALSALMGGAGTGLGVVVLLGCIAVAVYMWPPLLLTTPTLMLEQIRVWRAVRRSFHLVRRSWWRVWGIGALATLISAFVSGMLTGPATLISALAWQDGGVVPVVVATIGGSLATIVTMPFMASVCTLLYIDRRMRSEALDLELVRAAQAG